MPNPTSPPDGTYGSQVSGSLSAWSGSFTYTSANANQISYTRDDGQTFSAQNNGQGNVLNFTLNNQVHFVSTGYSAPGGHAQFTGNCNSVSGNKAADEDPWTATQSTTEPGAGHSKRR